MRKRSRYRPRRVDPNAWKQAIDLQRPIQEADLIALGLAIHVAIERMRTGRTIEEDFYTLAAAINVSLVLCKNGVCIEHQDVVIAGQDALMGALYRKRRIGTWGFSGPEMLAVNAAIAMHEKQVAAVPRIMCQNAMLEVRRRAETGEVLNVVPA